MDCHFLPPKNAIDTRPYPSEKAGIRPFEKGVVRKAYPDSDYPILIVDKFLFDDNGAHLPVGYYEVGLSNDKKFLILSQSKEFMAKVPVYQYEEIKESIEEEKEREKKEKERNKWKDAVKAKLTSDKFNVEKIEKRIDIWAKLIDYDDDYYIIEYRRNKDKAYGAIPKKF